MEPATPHLSLRRFGTKKANGVIPNSGLFEYSSTLTNLKPFSSYVLAIMSRRETDFRTFSSTVDSRTAETGE